MFWVSEIQFKLLTHVIVRVERIVFLRKVFSNLLNRRWHGNRIEAHMSYEYCPYIRIKKIA